MYEKRVHLVHNTHIALSLHTLGALRVFEEEKGKEVVTYDKVAEIYTGALDKTDLKMAIRYFVVGDK